MKVHLPHYSIDDSGDKLTITIPSKKQWFAIVLLLLWSSSWTMGGIAAIRSLFVDPNLFLLLWLMLWLVGEITAILSLLWEFTGKDIIEVTTMSMTIRHQVLGFGSPQKYLAKHIEDLRVSRVGCAPFGLSRNIGFLWLGSGVITFIYKGETIRTGEVGEAEGNQILDAIRERFPLNVERAHPKSQT